MSNINKILNDALENGLLNEVATGMENMPGEDPNAAGILTGETPKSDILKSQIKKYAKNPYVYGSVAALGAGLGAVALARKLRAKKAKAAKAAKK